MDKLYDHFHLFYLLRLLRLYKAARFVDPRYFNQIIVKMHSYLIDYRLKNNTEEENKSLFLHQLELTKVFYIILRLLVLLILFSYFIGLFWWLYVSFIE